MPTVPAMPSTAWLAFPESAPCQAGRFAQLQQHHSMIRKEELTSKARTEVSLMHCLPPRSWLEIQKGAVKGVFVFS